MKYLKRHRDEILIFSFFILLSLIATYPLIFRMKSYLYGLGGDSLGAAWYFWWLKFSIWQEHISPVMCNIVARPFDFDHSLGPQNIVMTYFVSALLFLFNETFTYNLMILFTFPLSAIIMYYLVYHFTRNKLAGIVSGVIYAFCPYHLVHATQHLGTASIQWMPLYFLALLRLDEERSYRWAFLAAIAFFLVVFSDYYQAYFMTVFTVAFVGWKVWQGIRRGRLSGYPVTRLSSEQKPETESGERRVESGKKKSKLPRKIPLELRGRRALSSKLHSFKLVLVAVVVAVAIILPFTYHTFRNMFATPERYVRSFRDLTSNSARPLGYLLPSQDNPLFGRFTKKFIKSPFYGGHPTEHTLYLGWVGIVLSIIAIKEWRRKSKLVNKLTSKQVNKGIQKQKTDNRLTGKLANWSTITQKGVSFFLFAGIVALIFSHSPYTEIGPFRILFPSYFMYKILPMFRVYARFGIVVMLCVSVLAGIGLASILEKIKTAKKRRTFLAIVLLLIFIEFAPTLPAPMINAVKPPSVYEWLTKQEGDFTIAEYPLEDDQEYFFWQRIHQKRLVNGAQSGTYADEVRKEIVDILKPETPGILKYLGTRYVILHPEKYLKSEDVPVIGEVPDVSKQKGLKLVETFKKARVYEVVAEPVRPRASKEQRAESGEQSSKL